VCSSRVSTGPATGAGTVGGRPAHARAAPFFRSSGLPFFTVAMTMSPIVAFGRRLRREPKPLTEMTYKFFAPVLSAQFMTAATFRPSVVRNLVGTDAERPARARQNRDASDAHGELACTTTRIRALLSSAAHTCAPPLDAIAQARGHATVVRTFLCPERSASVSQ